MTIKNLDLTCKTNHVLLAFPVFYMLVLRRLELPPKLDLILGLTFMGTFAVGFAFSVQARCMVLLILPTFFGRSGRSYIGTFALSLLLSGEKLCGPS